MKGYGLQTMRRHQLRGLVVCFRQKKATGDRAGYGCCSSSSDTQSGSRIGAVMRTPRLPLLFFSTFSSSFSSSCCCSSSWPPPPCPSGSTL
ncbi:hypothetical protein CHARACLAT_026947 [Characodon lateralis]|uniref:Uncharacterized protein n=1 Tax=Characodon lateralis TaxID=208331 RepID=A0ABU7EPB7_9TELE|nr:hypothetical protein [Characodon lateralis]